ncbi:MAG: ATP-binding cassette domain-containing protein [Clostridium sp.]
MEFLESSRRNINKLKSLIDVLINISRLEAEMIKITKEKKSIKATLNKAVNGIYMKALNKNIEIELCESNLKEEEAAVFRRRNIGFVFQDHNLITSLNVWENIVMPMGIDGNKVDKEFVEDIVRTLGLEGKKKKLPRELSGGQQQRVAIARALAVKSAIVLADEPTGNLDSKTEEGVITLFKLSAKKYCQTLVLITHDEGIAQMADRIIVLEDGRVVS